MMQGSKRRAENIIWSNDPGQDEWCGIIDLNDD